MKTCGFYGFNFSYYNKPKKKYIQNRKYDTVACYSKLIH